MITILKRNTIKYTIWNIPLPKKLLNSCKIKLNIGRIEIFSYVYSTKLEEYIYSIFKCPIIRQDSSWLINLPNSITRRCKIYFSHGRIQLKSESISDELEEDIIKTFNGKIIELPIIITRNEYI